MSRDRKLVTMQQRRARTGYLFIMPFIIGFVLFMARPMIQSLIMSFNNVVLNPGKGYNMTWVGLDNYHTAFAVDPYFNTRLVDEIGRMGINTIATLVMSFVIAVILNQDFKGRTPLERLTGRKKIARQRVLPLYS